MPDLKLGRLPDRVAIKHTFAATPELNKGLNLYAELYREVYGEDEPVATLVPFMLQAFLDGDRAFQRVLKDRMAAEPTADETQSTRRAAGPAQPA